MGRRNDMSFPRLRNPSRIARETGEVPGFERAGSHGIRIRAIGVSSGFEALSQEIGPTSGPTA